MQGNLRQAQIAGASTPTLYDLWGPQFQRELAEEPFESPVCVCCEQPRCSIHARASQPMSQVRQVILAIFPNALVLATSGDSWPLHHVARIFDSLVQDLLHTAAHRDDAYNSQIAG